MAMPRLLAALGRGLFGLVWSPFARVAWCRKQRRHLLVPGHSVVWVRGAALSWARWGAGRGYFEVQQMDGLSYIRSRD
jgi:hypothetical protein